MTAQPSAAMLPSQVLDAAADLIEPEGAWTQGVLSRDVFGSDLEDTWDFAVCWCASGAVGCAAEDDQFLWDEGVMFLRRTVGFNVPNWNDDPERTQPEVVKALRDAANLARSEGQ